MSEEVEEPENEVDESDETDERNEIDTEPETEVSFGDDDLSEEDFDDFDEP